MRLGHLSLLVAGLDQNVPMVNAEHRDRWKADTQASVAMYNEWFLDAAPRAFAETRAFVMGGIDALFKVTDNLRAITPAMLAAHPEMLGLLRMCAAPPLAVDRLAGLAGVPNTLIKTMEGRADVGGRLPPRVDPETLTTHLTAICSLLRELLDPELFA